RTTARTSWPSSAPEATRDYPSRTLVHRQGALRLPGEELADEGVVGVEHVLGRAGLHDAALPQDVDVVRHPAGAHDVVRDHAAGAPSASPWPHPSCRGGSRG